MVWRRAKVRENQGDVDKFNQEYPADAHLAFSVTGEDSFIKPSCVYKARKENVVQDKQKKVMGLDVARFGSDRTLFIVRHGRAVREPVIYENKDLMEIAGLAVHCLKDGTCEYIYLDIVGIGAGVYDRLIEMGYGDYVEGVGGAEKPIDDTYANKRAECWGEMRQWLTGNLAVSLPDCDALHSDLICPHYKYNSYGRLLLESKDDIRKRGMRSPDISTSLCLSYPLFNPTIIVFYFLSIIHIR